jgi:glycosyltransferase involved in cell wall biosynthesis
LQLIINNKFSIIKAKYKHRVIQLIDSLEPGGAEKMAVTLANELAYEIDFSGLMVTRCEGDLSNFINQKENYIFLNRKKIIDFGALLEGRRFLKKNKVEILHAHSSSYFFAVLLKLIMPKIKIVWHDHYGNSELLKNRKYFLLKSCSILFSTILVVNDKLFHWCEDKLLTQKIFFLSNFVVFDDKIQRTTILNGCFGKRIICLANLRPQKNHSFLIEIAQKIFEKNPDWTFHIVGNDLNDDYSKKIKSKIKHANLQNHVFIYGSRTDIQNILEQSTIGVLTSSSEGLPLALLEYGMMSLPVVTTNVGNVSKVITSNENGFLVRYDDLDDFVNSLNKLIQNEKLRSQFGKNNKTHIEFVFSKNATLKQLTQIYKTI